jgi:putative NADPH-quinone reductase
MTPTPTPSPSPGRAGAHPRILVLFAHPALERSRVNRRLADAVKNLSGVTFHDLYETYPEFDVDVEREQELLTRADLVVAQHPFFWYSTPALLKQWQDLVLEHLATHPSLKNADYRDLFDLTRDAAGRELRRLAQEGYLRMEGERRGAKYLPGPLLGGPEP